MFRSITNNVAKNLSAGGTITGDLTISGDLTVSGGGSLSFDEILEGTQVIDVTDTEAFLVRKNGDGGDVFVVNTDNVRVGIGIAVPSEVLHLYQANDGGDTTLRIQNADAGNSTDETVEIHFYQTSSGASGGKIVGGREGAYTSASSWANADSFMAFHTALNNADGERMRITSAGNVGIGGTPQSPLHLHQATSGATYMQFTNSTTGNSDAASGTRIGLDLNEKFVIYHQEDTDINFFTGATPTQKMTILSGGNVGIGDTDPPRQLSIYRNTSNTTPMVLIEEDGSGDPALQFLTTGVNDWTLGIDNSKTSPVDPFIIANGSTLTTGVKFVLDANSRISLSNNDVSGATGNTVFGKLAGNALASGGTNNVFIGENAGLVHTIGDFNVVIGHSAFSDTNNDDDSLASSGNVALGRDAMGGTWAGEQTDDCVAIGDSVMTGALSNVDGTVAIGKSALTALTSGTGNVAVGYQAGMAATDNLRNTVIGHGAYRYSTSSDDNVVIGFNALRNAGSAGAGSDKNIAIGSYALDAADGGENDNIAIGYDAMGNANNSSTEFNIAIGNYTLDAIAGNLQTGTIAIGHNSLTALTSGASNVAIGHEAAKTITTGGSNTIVGYNSLIAANTAANSNTTLGTGALQNASGSTCVGNVAIGMGALTAGGGDLTGNIAIGKNALDDTSGNNHEGTIAIGHQALSACTTGAGNTAVGFKAGEALVEGQYNTVLGYEAFDAGQEDSKCVAIGYNALTAADVSDTGSAVDTFNTAVGYNSGGSITTGLYNTILGGNAGDGFDTESHNTFIGYSVGGNPSLAGAEKCVGLGSSALGGAITQDGTVAIGYNTLGSLTTGEKNTAIGYLAGAAMTTSDSNTIVGYNAYPVGNNADGTGHNTIIGAEAALLATHADFKQNTFVGRKIGGSIANHASYQNTGVGHQCLNNITSGYNNIAVGRGAMGTVTTGNGNIHIGVSTEGNASGAVNEIVIGHGATGQADNSVTLGNADVTAVYMAQDSGATVNCGQVVSANTAIDTTGSFTGFSQTYKKTLGVTNSADNFIGTYITMEFDDDGAVDGTFGTLAGARIYSICTDSVGAGSAIYGTDTLAKLTVGNPDNVYGAYTTADIDGGTVDVSVHGANIVVDMDGGACGNDLYGLNVYADIDGGTIGDKLLGAKIAVNSTVNPATNARALYLLMDGSGLANDSDNFIHCYDDASNTNRFLVRMDGQVDAEGAINASQSLDYAEYFESKDGKQIAIGTTVKLDGGKIIACSDGDTPIGVIRPDGAPAMINGGQSFHWQDKYMKDDYGSKILENYTQTVWKEEVDFDEYSKRGKTSEEHELYSKVDGLNGESDTYFKEHSYHTDRIPDGLTVPDDAVVTSGKRDKLNPDYDDSKTYQPRKERSEWHIVGLLGQIPITKGQPTGSWIKMKDVSDTVEMYFVK